MWVVEWVLSGTIEGARFRVVVPACGNSVHLSDSQATYQERNSGRRI